MKHCMDLRSNEVMNETLYGFKIKIYMGRVIKKSNLKKSGHLNPKSVTDPKDDFRVF